MIPSTEDTCPNKDGAPAATLGGNAKEKDALAIPLSWEKIATLLKTVPCFIVPELLAFGVKEFSRSPTVISSTCAMTLAWLEWFVHPMSLRILHFGALIHC